MLENFRANVLKGSKQLSPFIAVSWFNYCPRIIGTSIMVTGTLEEGHTLVIFPEDLAFRTIAALSTFLLTREVHGDFAARPLTRRAADLVYLSLNGTNCT